MMSTDILGLGDGLLGEVGRRQHRFAWLLNPGAGPGEWLPVDAYYPSRRLVVVLDAAEPQAQLCTELMPQHGLRLLALSAGELGPDRAAAEPTLRGMLESLKLPERRRATAEAPPRAPARLADVFARVAASFSYAAAPAPAVRPSRPAQAAAAQRALRVVAARSLVPARPRPIPPVRHPRPSPPLSRRSRPATVRTGSAAPATALGVALGAIVPRTVLRRGSPGDGQRSFGLGLAFDACARSLGAVAARRAGAPKAAWTCAIAGSPGVALFTLFGPDGPVAVDPAPLAGVLSVLATLLVGVGLLGLLLGF